MPRFVLLLWDDLPSEIVSKIVAYLPKLTLEVLMRSENERIAVMACRSYYECIELRFCEPKMQGIQKPIDLSAIQISVPEFEALTKRNDLSQLHIKKLYVSVLNGIKNFSFLRGETFAKVSAVLSDVIIDLQSYSEMEAFDWNWLPADPQVWECIRAITILDHRINPNIPPLPSKLRKLKITQRDHAVAIKTNAPIFELPPRLCELHLCIPWMPMSLYGEIPSSLEVLTLITVKDFSVQRFNELNLANLKFLRLQTIKTVGQIDELFEMPLLLEELELCHCSINRFRQGEMPPNLKALYVVQCPLREFRAGTLPDTLTSIRFHNTKLLSSEVRAMKFPPKLRILEIVHSLLTSIAFVNALPSSLTRLVLNHNALGDLNEADGIDPVGAYAIVFPGGLETLQLEYNWKFFSSYRPSSLVFPPCLMELALTGMHMGSVEGLQLPPRLKFLNLSSNKIISIEALTIPPRLTQLMLAYNSLEEFSKILPDSIETLNLFNSGLTKLVNFHLPVNCSNFEISHNPLLKKLDFSNADDPCLKIRSLLLNRLDINTLGDISPLPECLETLAIRGSLINTLSGFRFPLSLKVLKATGNQITSLEGATFPPNLEILRLCKNKITSVANVEFPASLLNLELEVNKITSIDGIKLPPRLKRFDVESNAIAAIRNLQLPDSLRLFSILGQECETLARSPDDTTSPLRISSPRIGPLKGLSDISGLVKLPSNLKTLELCENSLTEEGISNLEIPDGLTNLHMHGNQVENYSAWIETIKAKYPNLEIDGGAEPDSDGSFMESDDSDYLRSGDGDTEPDSDGSFM
ncbi:hypothetical protein BABINDRAFT_162174 [Babjeviella inositovora NRRL Y-12698]|uniref:Uncharacterized protein n=1 Tax=Babjeviella inositovora NRRL Y-12698 TaxID=984486 RepID=A0A1E3QN29_9ASCO|nr:uncharacterized protein BABINDRAFT_162174 [Babjeviella inositovora NRRL Y-12698]ODQ79109.1 hypothetical protein BABINDRAFT_162174 [Babjeviella inositovora NRRL Y-12698]